MNRAGQSLFKLGRVVMTKAISERFASEQLVALVQRHECGDFGDLSHEDELANVLALQDDARIMSVYEIPVEGGEPVKVWIITEADRSATTVLFPSEY